MDSVSRACAYDHPDSTVLAVTGQFDLVAYARKHRYRLRNLHDGGPVPPARRDKRHTRRPGYTGPSDRWDAIVGHDGYVAMDGDELSVCLFYKSSKDVNRAITRLQKMGGRIDQVGDTELGATVPVERIEHVLKLIKVSKLPRGRPGGNPDWTKAPIPDAVLAPESHE